MSDYNNRETAVRAFADEFDDSTHTFKESDDDRAPNYQLLRTGAKANRLFVVGTLTEKEDIGSDNEYWRARVVDPTGTFFVYAGQYEPEAASTIRDLDTPAYVAVVGKPERYLPDDADDDDDAMMSLRAKDAFVPVDGDTRDKWVTETAERTLDRIDNTEGEYVGMAQEIYYSEADGSRADYRSSVVEALESLKEEDEE